MLAKRYKINHNMSMKQTTQHYPILIFFLIVLFTTTIGMAADRPVHFSAKPFISTSQNNATIIKLHIAPDSEYHFYSRKQGETGKPTSISVSPSMRDNSVRYPDGIKAHDPILKDKTTYLYKGAEDFFITIPDDTITNADITASLLLCSDVRCTPVRETIPVNWKGATLAQAESQVWWKKYSAITPDAPDAATHKISSSTNGNAKLAEELGVQLPTTSGSPNSSFTSKLNSNAPSISLPQPPKSAVPSIQQNNVTTAYEYNFTPRYFLQALEVSTLSKAILFGLLAGLILNFMPCVLPVVSLKLATLVAAAQVADKVHRRRVFREHNLFFALGILTWFSLLTIVLTSFGLAWGQLFQNESLLIGLTILIFALALSIFDIFPLPMFSLAGRGTENGNDRWSAFSTGLLATLLATPCSGPFLGGVLGWAFLQPISVLILIFLSIGIGMALPYFALALVPELIGRFPRPGAWSGTLSHIVGFFLMGTVVYLLYILPTKILPDMLIVLWVTAVSAWAWGRFSGLSFSKKRNTLVRLTCVLCVALAVFVVFKEKPQAKEWQAFAPKSFFSELQDKRLIIDFTADWCPNCKVLEQTVLTPANRARWEKEFDVTFIQVDLTQENTDKQKFLESLGSSSIPVVAIFPKGTNAYSPIILRDLFTTGQMEDALKKAFNE